MRVVFAGTPEVAVPALDAVAASRHELVGVVTRPDAPSGRGRKLVASPVAQRAEELGVPVLKPEHPRDPDFQAALARPAPRRVPGRGLRRAAAAVGARPRAARLDQPALLGAAVLARRRAGPALAVGRRRGHRRHDVPHRQGARRRPGVRRDDRADPARRHRRRPARRGSPRAAPGLLVQTLDGIEDGSLEAREQPEDGVSFAPEDPGRRRPRSTGPTPPSAIDRQVRACTPGARRLEHLRGRADQDRAGPARDRRAGARARRPRGHQERRPRRHRPPRPCGSARSRRSARSRWRAADWARGVRLESGVRLGD